jgi:hypothetical protein
VTQPPLANCCEFCEARRRYTTDPSFIQCILALTARQSNCLWSTGSVYSDTCYTNVKLGFNAPQVRCGLFGKLSDNIIPEDAHIFLTTGGFALARRSDSGCKWGTYKAIQARGLKVVEKAGKRSIVEDGGIGTSPAASVRASTLKACSPQATAVADTRGRDNRTREMWNSNDPDLWETALKRYWEFVKPSNLALEEEMDQLDTETVRIMDAQAWFGFLLEKYFRWKYTAANRYASTTKNLRSYAANNELSVLHAIKERLFAADKDNIQQCLALASSIRGLGTAGASGLLAVVFPAQFGTVDQFAVKALVKIPELPERHLITAMNPESLKLNEGTTLIHIMRRKAAELNRVSTQVKWTPRKVDMVLWSCAR